MTASMVVNLLGAKKMLGDHVDLPIAFPMLMLQQATFFYLVAQSTDTFTATFKNPIPCLTDLFRLRRNTNEVGSSATLLKKV